MSPPASTAMPHGLACLMIATQASPLVIGGATGGVRIDVVVVRHLLAVQLLGLRETVRAEPVGVQGGALVRVLSVAEDGGAVPGGADPRREAASVRVRRDHASHPGRHGHVVGAGVHEGVRRQALPLLQGEAARTHGVEHLRVAGGRHDNGHTRVVLRCRPHHGRPTDVDLLDALVRRRAGRHGLGERVEVDDDQVEGLDAKVGQLLLVVGLAPVGKNARVHARVQRLDSAVQALGEAGEVLHLRHRHSGIGDPGRRRARRHQADPCLVQPLRELDQAGLVVDAHERSTNGTLRHVRTTFLPSMR